MSTEFAHDLKLARRKAGFTQKDCVHLLAIKPEKLSLFERGKMIPSLPEICKLSLIYGRSFESLFAEIMQAAKEHLYGRLKTIPPLSRQSASTTGRAHSLSRLEQRLSEELSDNGSA